MKHRGTKILSLLLSFVLVLSLMPGLSLTAYADEYQLWVGGVQVTSDNLTIDSNDNTAISGSAVYDPSTCALTLNNFSYTGPGYDGGGEGGGIDCRMPNLTIMLVGSNSITKKDDNHIGRSHGIYFAGETLTIDGSGSLTISFDAGRGGWKSNGIFCEPGKFVMNGGTVTATAGTGQESAGIYTDDGIIFNGGTFTGNGYYTTDYESRGIYSHGTITVNGGTVTGTTPLDNPYEARGFDNGTVTINGGTVTAIGKAAFSSSYGVRAGEGITLDIKAGENEASAATVTSVPGGAKYVHITAKAPTVPVTGVTLDPGSVTLAVGGVQKLTATVSPADATDKKVKWSIIEGDHDIGLYSDEGCTTPFTLETATDTLTAYVKGITVDMGGTVQVESNADPTKTATCTVKVTAKTYTVTVNSGPKGSATADKTTAAAGETVTLTVTPDNGYEVLAIAASDANNNQITVTNNSFTMPAANVTVTVQFKEKTTPQPVQPTQPTPQPTQPTPQPTVGKYTVTYDANNGSGEKKTQGPYDAGTTYTVEGCSFAAPAGKVFDCWQGSDGKTYKVGSPVVLNANLTLTARWKDAEAQIPDVVVEDPRVPEGDIVFIGGFGGAEESWEYVGAPQRAWKVSLAPMVNGSAALGIMTGESTTTEMNVYPTTTIYVFPNPNPGYVLDKIIWSLIDGSASYDITEAKNFVMPAMDAVVYVTFRPAG